MKKSLRAASIVCALTLLASVTTACQNNTGSTTDNSSTGADNTSSTGKVDPANAVEVSWWVVGNGQPSNYDEAKKVLDEYSAEKIGVKLDLHCIAWGEWDQRRTSMLNSNEQFDIMFENQVDYVKYANYGSFEDITDMVKNETPDLYAATDELLWKGVSVNGKIYGVPSVKDNAQVQMFAFDASLVDKLGLKDAVDNCDSIQDLEPILSAMKPELEAQGKDPYPLPLNQNEGLPGLIGTLYDGLAMGLPPVGVSLKDHSTKVVSVFEQEDIKQDLATLHDYYQKGYINSNANTLTESPTYKAVMTAQGWEGAEVGWAFNNGVDEYYAKRYRGPFMTSETIQGSVNCIGSGSDKKAEALKYLELINTDSTFRNMLAYGIEGTNWEYVDDEKDTVVKLNDEWGLASYTQGSYMILAPQLADASMKETHPELGKQYSETVANYNEQALSDPSPLLGFVFDSSNYATQVANCNNVWMKYRNDLWTGASDPDEILPQMIAELKQNGMDDLIAAAQEQIDTFLQQNS